MTNNKQAGQTRENLPVPAAFQQEKPSEWRGVAAVSGGPDSMAMLAMMVRLGLKPVVCHVNYHKRDTASRDEMIVRDYCQEHGLILKVLNPGHPEGNFQDWARRVRYAFFEQTADKYKIRDIYLAHQKDDVLETYIMQKKRGILCESFGIRKITVKTNHRYIRPLLELNKEDLENWCVSNGIPFGIDESNLSDDYTRNRIRHSIIEKMTDSQKAEMLEAMEKDNLELGERRAKADAFLSMHPAADLLDQPGAWFLLERFLYPKTQTHYSRAHLEDMVCKLKQHALVDLQDHILERHEDQLYVMDKNPGVMEPLVIESPEQLEQMLKEKKKFGKNGEYYQLTRDGQVIESVFVDASDFPLVFAPWNPDENPGAKIRMRFGSKKVRRIYIDQKLPHFIRQNRPVLWNKAGEIIFIPFVGCDVSHFSPNPSFHVVKF